MKRPRNSEDYELCMAACFYCEHKWIAAVHKDCRTTLECPSCTSKTGIYLLPGFMELDEYIKNRDSKEREFDGQTST